jgi:hypothetical protein
MASKVALLSEMFPKEPVPPPLFDGLNFLSDSKSKDTESIILEKVTNKFELSASSDD